MKREKVEPKSVYCVQVRVLGCTVFCTTLKGLFCSQITAFIFSLPFFPSRILFDIFPVSTEANPTDVPKVGGVKQANAHLIVFLIFLAAIKTFHALCLKEHHGKTFLS